MSTPGLNTGTASTLGTTSFNNFSFGPPRPTATTKTSKKG